MSGIEYGQRDVAPNTTGQGAFSGLSRIAKLDNLSHRIGHG